MYTALAHKMMLEYQDAKDDWFRSCFETERIRPSMVQISYANADTQKYFQVMVNVTHFKPEDVHVKIVDNFLVVDAEHEDTADKHGFVKRKFTRRYQLPEGVVESSFKIFMSSDGLLIITAPRNAAEKMAKNVTNVPMEVQEPWYIKRRQELKTTMSNDDIVIFTTPRKSAEQMTKNVRKVPIKVQDPWYIKRREHNLWN